VIEQDLPAGDFASWFEDMRAALRGERDAEVPCGGCTACCTSSQFVHIGPDETDTLAAIPPDLLAPAPLMPPGYVVLGYDERGHCPMLVDGACSIYEHRPRTCRTYDCRVFAATGVEPDDPAGAIAEWVRRWRFTYPTEDDGALRDVVRAAAASIQEGPDRPRNTTEHAVRAIAEARGA
jgi:Fe-S-cluster containining protein